MMAMTNVYFRFTYMAQNRDYETLRAGLRINAQCEVLATPQGKRRTCRLHLASWQLRSRARGLSALTGSPQRVAQS